MTTEKGSKWAGHGNHQHRRVGEPGTTSAHQRPPAPPRTSLAPGCGFEGAGCQAGVGPSTPIEQRDSIARQTVGGNASIDGVTGQEYFRVGLVGAEWPLPLRHSYVRRCGIGAEHSQCDQFDT